MGADSVIRITGTRVPLETVIGALEEDLTPEQIVQQYPSISLGDVYRVREHYLNNWEEIKRYLDFRLSQAQQTKQSNEARWKPDGVRDRLLSRRGGPSRY